MSEFTDYNNLLNANEFDKLNAKIQNDTLVMEPFLIQIIPELLNKLTDNKTASQAKETGNLIISKMNCVYCIFFNFMAIFIFIFSCKCS